ncbi:MAG TPA: hypothetical protein VMW24_28685 [Sedimentisphaerales bacterium]|nr:hypothetical protein [Sedimentisphaerales bacterium]
MNRAQKIARFNLKVIAVGGGLSVLAILASLPANAMALTYLGFFVLGVTALIAGLSPLLVRKEPGRVSFDERDAAIEKKAHLVGYCTLWCVFIATCMIAIPRVGPAILAVTLAAVKLVESAAVLVRYAWGNKGEES